MSSVRYHESLKLLARMAMIRNTRPLPSKEVDKYVMKLYGFGPTRSLRALWCLRELGADFEFVPVNLLAGENQSPEFLALNPAGKLPVLVDGDSVITESAAIVLYLAEKYPDLDNLSQNGRFFRRRVGVALPPGMRNYKDDVPR